MGLYSGGLIIVRIFASEIRGAYFREGLCFFFGGGAYYRNFAVAPLTNDIAPFKEWQPNIPKKHK